MDTKTQIELTLQELKESLSKASNRTRKENEASLGILQELIEREKKELIQRTRFMTSQAEDSMRLLKSESEASISLLKYELAEIEEELISSSSTNKERRKKIQTTFTVSLLIIGGLQYAGGGLPLNKDLFFYIGYMATPVFLSVFISSLTYVYLKYYKKGLSQEYILIKRRLDDSDDLLVRYLDDSLKPITLKKYVEYYIEEDKGIRERLDQLTKLRNKIGEEVREVHEAPIPDEAKNLMATLADKLERNTVTEEGSRSKAAQGIFKKLIDEWLPPGFVGAGVAVAALWSFIMVPSANVMVEGTTDVFQKPYIQNVTGQYPIPTYRGGEAELSQDALALKGVITRALEDRYELSKITQGETEIIINLRGAFVSEKGEHCDSGELSYVDTVAFFVGCRETENNWNIKFLE